ncbi:unnamed protein product, partial [Ixodes hexagonus]
MGRLDRLTNGVVIATVTTTVVIILVIFITTERHVFLSRDLPPAGDEPTDAPPALPWSLIDRQAFLSHRILATGGRHTKRLPRHVVPIHYDLEIQPHIGDSGREEDTFSGQVTIRFRCLVETSTITVHSSPDLRVSMGSRVTPGVIVRHASQSFYKMWARSLALHAYDEFLLIKLMGKLAANETYLITMRFSGKLGSDRGFYKYHYKVNGKTNHLLLTFFEPTYARRAFPCFDEPDLKATFAVTIVRPSGYKSLSTMPLNRSEHRHHKLVADHFQTTMPMSTYTLAFAVLNFTSQTNGNVSDQSDQRS